MDLSKILTIGGKPGLFLIKKQLFNGAIVEGIQDGRTFTYKNPVGASTLAEIQIYTEDEEAPLTVVFTALKEKFDGGQAISHKSSNDELVELFSEILPEYDKERVYPSHIKKVINWYNILQAADLLKEEVKEEETESTEETTEENK